MRAKSSRSTSPPEACANAALRATDHRQNCLALGAIGAALTVGLRRGGVLISLLVLPLFIPVLIFGVGAVDAAVYGLTAKPHLMMLGGLLVASLPLAPWAAAAALRLSLE